MVFFGDNGGGAGGTEPSNNYPLRGTKAEPWEGAIRVAAFVSGGFIPARLRGSTNAGFMSVADWYPTLLSVAGLNPAQIADTVEYNGTARPIDGIDAWPMLTGAPGHATLGREWLPTTNQARANAENASHSKRAALVSRESVGLSGIPSRPNGAHSQPGARQR